MDLNMPPEPDLLAIAGHSIEDTEPPQSGDGVFLSDPHLINEMPRLPHLSARHCRILFISVDGFGDLPANQALLTAPDVDPIVDTIKLSGENTDSFQNNPENVQVLENPETVTTFPLAPLPQVPKSPLALYPLPHLARLRRSAFGLLDPVAPGLACGSDTAHLSLLGNNPNAVYRGRGALEGIGGGVAMPSGCIAFKSCLGEYDLLSQEGVEYITPLSSTAVSFDQVGNALFLNRSTSQNVDINANTFFSNIPNPVSNEEDDEFNSNSIPPMVLNNGNGYLIPDHLLKHNSLRDNLTSVTLPLCTNRKLKEKERYCITLCEDLDQIEITQQGYVLVRDTIHDVSQDDQVCWNKLVSISRKELFQQIKVNRRSGVDPSIIAEQEDMFAKLDIIPPPIPSITHTQSGADGKLVPVHQHSLSPEQLQIQSILHPPCPSCRQPYTIFGYCFCQLQCRVYHAGGHRCVVLLSHPMGLSDCVNDTDPCKPNLLLRVSVARHPSPSALFTSLILNRLSRASAICLGLGRIVLLRGAGMSISLRSPFNITAVACTHIVAGVAMTLGSNVFNIPEPNGCLDEKIKAVAVLLGLYLRSKHINEVNDITQKNSQNFAAQFIYHRCTQVYDHIMTKYDNMLHNSSHNSTDDSLPDDEDNAQPGIPSTDPFRSNFPKIVISYSSPFLPHPPLPGTHEVHYNDLENSASGEYPIADYYSHYNKTPTGESFISTKNQFSMDENEQPSELGPSDSLDLITDMYDNQTSMNCSEITNLLGDVLPPPQQPYYNPADHILHFIFQYGYLQTVRCECGYEFPIDSHEDVDIIRLPPNANKEIVDTDNHGFNDINDSISDTELQQHEESLHLLNNIHYNSTNSVKNIVFHNPELKQYLTTLATDYHYDILDDIIAKHNEVYYDQITFYIENKHFLYKQTQIRYVYYLLLQYVQLYYKCYTPQYIGHDIEADFVHSPHSKQVNMSFSAARAQIIENIDMLHNAFMKMCSVITQNGEVGHNQNLGKGNNSGISDDSYSITPYPLTPVPSTSMTSSYSASVSVSSPRNKLGSVHHGHNYNHHNHSHGNDESTTIPSLVDDIDINNPTIPPNLTTYLTSLPSQTLTTLNLQTLTPALNPTHFPTTFYHIKTTDDMSHEGDFLFKANVLKNTDNSLGYIMQLFDMSWDQWEETFVNWIVDKILTLKFDDNSSKIQPQLTHEDSPTASRKTTCICFDKHLNYGSPNFNSGISPSTPDSVCICTCDMPLPPTPIVVCLLGDHSTPCSYAEHSTEPVPLMIHTIYRSYNDEKTINPTVLPEQTQCTMTMSSTTENRTVYELFQLHHRLTKETGEITSTTRSRTVHHESRPQDLVTNTLSESASVGGSLGRVKGGDIMRFCHHLAFHREQEWYTLVHLLHEYAQLTIKANIS